MSDEALGWTSLVLLVLSAVVGLAFVWTNALCGPFREELDVAFGVTAAIFGVGGCLFGMAWLDR